MRNLVTASWHSAREAEALAFARKRFAETKAGGNQFSEHSLLSEQASQALFRRMMQMALQNPVNRMQIVAGAKGGDPDAIDFLKPILLDAKSRRRMDELPTELIEYDMWLTAHGEKRERRSEKRDYIMRDIYIAGVVAEIVDRYKIDPTGRSVRRRSACDIVAEALSEVGMQMSYAGVKTIWGKYQNAMPTVPEWAQNW